ATDTVRRGRVKNLATQTAFVAPSVIERFDVLATELEPLRRRQQEVVHRDVEREPAQHTQFIDQTGGPVVRLERGRAIHRDRYATPDGAAEHGRRNITDQQLSGSRTNSH